MFSELRVWDTAKNNGVLIYRLLADRDVEIVVDRDINERVKTAEWELICLQMEQAFFVHQYERGVVDGIAAIERLLIQHFPVQTGSASELPDKPVIL